MKSWEAEMQVIIIPLKKLFWLIPIIEGEKAPGVFPWTQILWTWESKL